MLLACWKNLTNDHHGGSVVVPPPVPAKARETGKGSREKRGALPHTPQGNHSLDPFFGLCPNPFSAKPGKQGFPCFLPDRIGAGQWRGASIIKRLSRHILTLRAPVFHGSLDNGLQHKKREALASLLFIIFFIHLSNSPRTAFHILLNNISTIIT